LAYEGSGNAILGHCRRESVEVVYCDTGITSARHVEPDDIWVKLESTGGTGPDQPLGERVALNEQPTGRATRLDRSSR
jgi:hypothetical protein